MTRRFVLIVCLAALSGCGVFKPLPLSKDKAPEDQVLQPATGVPLDQIEQDPAPPETEPTPPASDIPACPAGQFLDAIGQPADDITFPENTRIVAPGLMVTADFVPERMTVQTNAFGIITAINCG